MGNLFYDEPRQPQRDYVMDHNGKPIRVGTRVRRLECYATGAQLGKILTVTLINIHHRDPGMDGLSYNNEDEAQWDADRFEVVDG